jgi:hypothetical protein
VAGSQGEAVDRVGAAGHLAGEVAAPVQDSVGGGGIDPARLVVGQVMGQVGAHHDQGFVAPPQGLQHLGHRAGAGAAHRQRDQPEFAQQGLQEGQLHLQGVFQGMGAVVDLDLRQAGHGGHGGLVQFDAAERGVEGGRVRQGQARQPHPVHRAEQHHPLDAAGEGGEQGVGAGGDRAGIDVAGMGHDDGLGRRTGRRPVASGIQHGGNLAPQGCGVARVEHARHCWRSDLVHGHLQSSLYT